MAVAAVGIGALVLSGGDDSSDSPPGTAPPGTGGATSSVPDAAGDDPSGTAPPGTGGATSSVPDAAAGDDPEAIVVEMLTVTRCADVRDNVADASLPSFDEQCTDGTADVEPTTELVEEDGSTAVVMVSYAAVGTARTDEVTLIMEDGSWKVSAWSSPDGNAWIHPS